MGRQIDSFAGSQTGLHHMHTAIDLRLFEEISLVVCLLNPHEEFPDSNPAAVA